MSSEAHLTNSIILCAGGKVVNVLFAGVMAGYSLGQAIPNVKVSLLPGLRPGNEPVLSLHLMV